ncbi:hypothetical protein Mal15_01000 [Stieleria maiorica]|uniref:PDZ domain-containing protein n=1 Tax=Stieleria maiorica TaxID=2795974 RepID=A0A5B9M937_9BACT|nr:PDZ domain-containing protein [Stieleria maiorica]QEF96074.1 hypothetical protein Mal15_01000 [Stieleria maiorica]
MSIRLLSGTAATLLLSLAVVAQVPPPTAAEPQGELTLKPVPPLLRLHLPILGRQRGVLIESVLPESAAAKTGLRDGDILLEAGGRAVLADDSLDTPDSSFPIVVLRRGRTRVLHPTVAEHRFFDRMFGPPIPGNPPTGTSASASAISSGSGSRAVSISRAGDQIAIEMSLPELADDPIRLRGTAAEIEQQLQQSAIGEAVKREVRDALRQAR